MDEEGQFAVLAGAAGRGGLLPRPRVALETMPGGWRVSYVIFAKCLTGGTVADLVDFERLMKLLTTLDVCAPLPVPFWTTRR